jgi:bacillithiol system protein YtxJ
MAGRLAELHSIEDFDRAIEESSARPVLLFKHSRTCPISARALREFETHLEAADPAVSYVMITVQSDRPVSNEAAARLGVAHESPQAILVQRGRAVWNASHFDITADKLDQAIRGNAQ